MKNKLLGYIFIAAVFAATVSGIYYISVSNSVSDSFLMPINHHGQSQKPQTYTNTDFGFVFNYDKNYALDISGNQANFFKNPGVSLVSASIPQSFYPKTNFGLANLTIAVQTKSTQKACEASAKTEQINGTTFHVSEESGAAAGTYYQSKIYRIFQNQHCFEVSLTTGIANIGNFEPGTTTEVDANNVWKRLDEMLMTFKFTVVAAVFDPGASQKTGILSGHVTVGPICPVEQISHPCLPTPEMNMARQVGVFDNSRLIASQHLDGNGNYLFTLNPGTYTVNASSMSVDLLNAVEGTVTITAGKTSTLNFSIDTGIR
jgi:hypothetical protein